VLYITCTLYIGGISVDEKGRLFDPCYHESEVFFQIFKSSGFQGLLAICHLGLSLSLGFEYLIEGIVKEKCQTF
jgi:hypothetical protein